MMFARIRDLKRWGKCDNYPEDMTSEELAPFIDEMYKRDLINKHPEFDILMKSSVELVTEYKESLNKLFEEVHQKISRIMIIQANLYQYEYDIPYITYVTIRRLDSILWSLKQLEKKIVQVKADASFNNFIEWDKLIKKDMNGPED